MCSVCRSVLRLLEVLDLPEVAGPDGLPPEAKTLLEKSLRSRDFPFDWREMRRELRPYTEGYWVAPTRAARDRTVR